MEKFHCHYWLLFVRELAYPLQQQSFSHLLKLRREDAFGHTFSSYGKCRKTASLFTNILPSNSWDSPKQVAFILNAQWHLVHILK